MTTPPVTHIGFFNRRFSVSIALFCLTLAFAGCMRNSEQSQNAAMADSNIKQLAYGVSIAVPAGWVVDNALTPESNTKAALDARAGKGERVMLISMHRPSNSPEGRDALVALFLVDAARNFQPETRTAALTPEELTRYGQAILSRDREAAQRNKSESNLLTWNVTKSQLDGNLALIHTGTAKGPTGSLELCDVNMYLPGDRGIALKSISDPNIPGTSALISGIVSSIHVAK